MEPVARGVVTSVNFSEKKGVAKRPLPEGELEAGFGLRGDAHGGTVRELSLLAAESIQKSREQWGLEVSAGSFGENLTTEGVELHTLPLGSIIRIGEATTRLIQVGKACHAGCEIKTLTGKCIMPAEGVFVAVQTGGRVRKGDEVLVYSPSSAAGG